MSMLSGKRTAIYAASLGASFAVLGCISFPSSKPEPPGLLNPRLQTKGDPVPDLRIRGDQVAQGKDIPVVPLPSIPRGSSETIRPPAKPNPPAGPIMPVGATAPASPRSDVPPPPANPLPLPAPPASPPEVSPANPAPTATDVGPAAPKGDAIKRLQQQAVEAYAGMDSYIARLTRREVVNGKAKPEEVMLFKFRKQPWSVYFKWLGDEGKGREVVYVKGAYENKLHTLLANGDMPALLMPPDHRMALAVDSTLVRSASRHSITEAGIGHCIEHLARIIEGVERGDKKLGTVADLGLQKRPEYPKPLPMIEHAVPPGLEPGLPRGGKRLYGFDPDNHLPVLVVTRDDKGQEVEYYRYDCILFPVKLDADDFDPDKLWKAPKR
jgi:hypothetical protein